MKKKIIAIISVIVIACVGIGVYKHYDNVQKAEALAEYEKEKTEYQTYSNLLNWMYNSNVADLEKELKPYSSKISEKTITDEEREELAKVYEKIDKAYAEDKSGCEKFCTFLEDKYNETSATLTETGVIEYNMNKSEYDGFMEKGNYKSAVERLWNMATILNVEPSEEVIEMSDVTASANTPNTNSNKNTSRTNTSNTNSNATSNGGNSSLPATNNSTNNNTNTGAYVPPANTNNVPTAPSNSSSETPSYANDVMAGGDGQIRLSDEERNRIAQERINSRDETDRIMAEMGYHPVDMGNGRIEYVK